MAKKEKLIIFDTTLRDGEQAPGASLSSPQKVNIAMQLERLGVDIIEAGFPVASPDDFEGVVQVARHVKDPIVCGLARCIKKDIDAAADALKKARRGRIHVFLATSKLHLQYKFKKKEDDIARIARECVTYARKKCGDIEFSPEDATRTDRDFLYRIIEDAVKSGATTINIPDTVGYSYPDEMYNLIKGIRENVPNIGKAVIAVHCHNDLGMATANSIHAIAAGARQVHCTVNGIGERAGNASLEEIIMTIKTRKDVFSNLAHGINTRQIVKTSKLVSALTGFVLPPNKAIVGENAFRHESGIHQDAIIKERTTYEIMDPRDIGLKGTNLVLGKHSGRHALLNRLKELGFVLEDDQVEEVFERFKIVADKKKEVFDEDLVALVEDAIKPVSDSVKLESITVSSRTGDAPEVEVTIEIGGKKLTRSSTGDGPVDACFKAVDKIVKVTPKPRLAHYKLDAVTSGKDAMGQARVELRSGKRVVSGVASSTDVIEASVKAYLDALNKLV
jgi:2-isopropylmalate synthase